MVFSFVIVTVLLFVISQPILDGFYQELGKFLKDDVMSLLNELKVIYTSEILSLS